MGAAFCCRSSIEGFSNEIKVPATYKRHTVGGQYWEIHSDKASIFAGKSPATCILLQTWCWMLWFLQSDHLLRIIKRHLLLGDCLEWTYSKLFMAMDYTGQFQQDPRNDLPSRASRWQLFELGQLFSCFNSVRRVPVKDVSLPSSADGGERAPSNKQQVS